MLYRVFKLFVFPGVFLGAYVVSAQVMCGLGDFRLNQFNSRMKIERICSVIYIFIFLSIKNLSSSTAIYYYVHNNVDGFLFFQSRLTQVLNFPTMQWRIRGASI